MVDTHHEHGSISRGGRDDHTLGTTLQVSLERERESEIRDYITQDPSKIASSDLFSFTAPS